MVAAVKYLLMSFFLTLAVTLFFRVDKQVEARGFEPHSTERALVAISAALCFVGIVWLVGRVYA